MKTKKTPDAKKKSDALTNISSIDGRYFLKTTELGKYLSEYALFKYRVIVEIECFKASCDILPQLKDFPREKFQALDAIIENFSPNEARKIKRIEKKTNHDVKAVEYYLRKIFDQLGLGTYKEFIHFGLTSYDINSPAVNMKIRDGLNQVVIPALDKLIFNLTGLATKWENIPMLAHTHGQPASPTKLGKEIYVFVERLLKLRKKFDEYQFEAKFGGATGNFNAHHVAYPEINWPIWADEFLLKNLGLVRQQTTTQIEHYDNLAELFDLLKRINTVFIDLSRDMWTYISMGYFTQKVKKGEVGSSAMPHKVNPIEFENAEGNAGTAISAFEYLSATLPISRLQRDLKGSTVERTIGTPIAHFLISILSLQKGFSKVDPNVKKMDFDLDHNWAVVSEGIQTILRRENYPDPYRALKRLTRKGENQMITKEIIHAWIKKLKGVSNEVKDELRAITPWNYTGV